MLLPATDGNYLFFEWSEKHKDAKPVDCTSDVLKELLEIFNSFLQPESRVDFEKFKNGINVTIGSKTQKKDLLNHARDYFFQHMSNHVNDLGIHKNHLILVCIFKYFLELADERKEYFKQKTVTFKQATHIMEQATKVLNVLLPGDRKVSLKPIKDHIELFAKKQTDREKDAINMKLMKETNQDILYELFIKNIQQ